MIILKKKPSEFCYQSKKNNYKLSFCQNYEMSHFLKIKKYIYTFLNTFILYQCNIDNLIKDVS